MYPIRSSGRRPDLDQNAGQNHPGDKMGKYEMVCSVRLNSWFPISLSSTANRIGAGNPEMILKREMYTVLNMTYPK